MTWIQDLFDPKTRSWEDLYRNRWSHDQVVRSTHGVNCTGGCSWNIHVKQGLVTWESQALDYPRIDPEIPSYEPRGCQRGISHSWYIYSALRVKYPYVRGALLDLWKAALDKHKEPLAAWESLVSDPVSRASWQKARGKGGFRRVSWSEVLPMLAAANLSTAKRLGPDRVIGFSPIPAMSMVSYAAGARYLQLLGGVCLSFYDWYCDLPPASPEIWGEQTDVAESADWYKSKFIAVVGSNVLMTRTPDAHFLVEARHQGAKVVVFSPDFSQTSKVADEWVPIHQGQDGAFWMAVGHVLLKEFHKERRVEAFAEYLKRYSDGPFLVELTPAPAGSSESSSGSSESSSGSPESSSGSSEHRAGESASATRGTPRNPEELRGTGAQPRGTRFRPGRFLRLSDVDPAEEHADWKTLVFDRELNLRAPMGTVGHRWQKQKGQWNLEWRDAKTSEEYEPLLSLDGVSDETVAITIEDFSEPGTPNLLLRRVPAKWVETANGRKLVTTAFDVLLAQYGVECDSLDPAEPFTPAWQERFTGVSAADVVRFARELGSTAERTNGRCMVVIGAGVNHWYHNNLIYRAAITALMVTGCIGKSGGGWNHYVGQEKLVPIGSWAPIAFATDWGGPPRLQNTPSFHYMHSSQWRYDRPFREVCAVSDPNDAMADGHTADRQAMAVRSGWLPCYPQFDRPNHEVLAAAQEAGATTNDEIAKFVAEELRERRLRFSMEDPDKPESWPRIFWIWRGNALQASAKGHEYFLKHYLGTDHASIASEAGKDSVEDVIWREAAADGKLDLIVDINFRMDTSALYSDVVLPAATWYEKDDLNSTDMHSFLHPLQKAVPPCWESKSDWEVFRELARVTQEIAQKTEIAPLQDLVVTPLLHDTPAELAQPEPRDWAKGECEPIAGRTLPNVTTVQRDYAHLYDRFVSVGPKFRDMGLGAHGTKYEITDVYDRWIANQPAEHWNGRAFPSLHDDRQVCETILHFAAETNGELAWRALRAESEKTGRDHTHLADATRGVTYSFDDLVRQPRRVLTSPFWTGITANGRTYAGFAQNIEELIPWRTLTGRQHLYLDHPTYRAFGEHVPTFKPRPDERSVRDLEHTPLGERSLVLNYLTPHGKWHIHSTYGDNLRMETLSRGIEPFWMNDGDAKLLGIEDNDWVEILNDHGVVVTRACVSARIPKGICFIYHATERTIGTPKSVSRTRDGKPRRAGAHNSLNRVRLKPLLMIGGYAQFTWAFNYWGPPGINRDTYVVVKKLTELVW